MSELNIQDFLAKAKDHFIPEKAEGIDAVVQLHLTGDQGGDWNVTIKDKKVQVNNGVVQNPRLTMSADSQDILKILTGQMDGMRAFMQGKLKVTGDMGLAMKLVNLFKP